MPNMTERALSIAAKQMSISSSRANHLALTQLSRVNSELRNIRKEVVSYRPQATFDLKIKMSESYINIGIEGDTKNNYDIFGNKVPFAHNEKVTGKNPAHEQHILKSINEEITRLLRVASDKVDFQIGDVLNCNIELHNTNILHRNKHPSVYAIVGNGLFAPIGTEGYFGYTRSIAYFPSSCTKFLAKHKIKIFGHLLTIPPSEAPIHRGRLPEWSADNCWFFQLPDKPDCAVNVHGIIIEISENALAMMQPSQNGGNKRGFRYK